MMDNDRFSRQSLRGDPQCQQIWKVSEQFTRAWEAEARPDLAAFLPAPDNPLRGPILLELIKLDQKFRCRQTQLPTLERYLQAWPEISQCPMAVLDLLTSECVCRSTYLTAPDHDELVRRFAEVAGHINLSDMEAQSKLARRAESYLSTERFFLIRKLGAGGMGVVYEAFDRRRQGLVALKILPSTEPTRLYRFKREFRALAEIVHPNLASLYELISVEGQWFFTMELVDGQDFLTYIRRHSFAAPTTDPSSEASQRGTPGPISDEIEKATSARIDCEMLRELLRQVVEGVGAIHREGKLHRDIKPSNVLVKPNGNVVVLDFGLITELASDILDSTARGSSDRSESASGLYSSAGYDAVGTVSYMSPEQAACTPLSAASDWYAVGVMLYEALTGNCPFVGSREFVMWKKTTSDPPQPAMLRKDIPADLNALCVELLHRDPKKRPSEADLVARLKSAGPSICGGGQWRSARQLAPFVGRGAQLSQLNAAFAKMARGKTVIVHLSGSSGAGKSRLAQQFLETLPHRDEVTILSGVCYERESVPYKALDSLMDSLCRQLERSRLEDIRLLIPADIAALARVFPVLQRVRAISTALQPLEIPEAREVRRRAFSALRELLIRLGKRKPLVLHIDDMQWGDEDSAAVLSEVLRSPGPPRLMLLVSYRSEQAQKNPSIEALHTIERQSPESQLSFHVDVGPLAAEESRRLARILLGEQTPDSALDLIAHESQGTPYFVIELAENLPAIAGDSTWRAPGESLRLEQVLWKRVGQMPDSSRRLLEMIAVAGKPLEMQNAYDAADVRPYDQQALARLRSARLVRTEGPNLNDRVDTFHDRVRASVVSHLRDETRRLHHGRLAHTLETWGKEDAETIAVHFHAAGQVDKAHVFYVAAGDRAAQTLAFDRAARLYQLSLELKLSGAERDWTLHSKLGDALANAGRGAEAAEHYQTAAQGVEAERRLDFERRAAYQFMISGRLNAGRAAFDRVLRSLGIRQASSPRIALLSVLGRRCWLRLRGLAFRQRSQDEIPRLLMSRLDACWSAANGLGIVDVIRAADFQARGLLLALRAGDPVCIARALALEAIHTAAAGTFSQRRTAKLLQECARVARLVNQPYLQGVLLLAKSATSLMQGHYRAAQESATQAEAMFLERCTGVAWELDTTRTYLHWSLVALGEVSEIRRLAPLWLNEARQRGDLLAMTTLNTYTLPLLLVWEDQADKATETICEAMRNWSQLNFDVQHLLEMVSQAEIWLYRGDGLSAWNYLESQWRAYHDSMLARVQHGYIVLLFLRARSALFSAMMGISFKQMLRAARADARRLVQQKRSDGDALAHLIQAGAFRLLGNLQAAIEHLELAILKLERVEMNLHLAAARMQLGKQVGGLRGTWLTEQGVQWMLAQGIGNPGRLMNSLTPGFPKQALGDDF